ncbi:uncharacterized protein C5orf49-like [Homalodisca vitripennis]|uniref:uncharacterized protein C5orf49-like n=1 Tax=Homalodisca vitripennis TaxID=197043 RepID=UPI001EEC1738|nr:uncharacterized protein C5orf49-like [Homalodisca vitripennis]KAG8253648.1 hypothetical protein J6590_029222 [Homalodisca vitripennis]
MPKAWFTPQQYIQARQYTWQKLEKDKNLVLVDIPENEKITYFNRPKKEIKKSQYDILFHFEHGWDQKMWRSDRSNPKIFQDGIHNEEEERIVPVLTSSIYGHRRTNLEGKPLFVNKRFQSTREFYRVNSVNMKPSRGLPKDQSTNCEM